MLVLLTTTTFVAAALPIVTAAPAAKFVPVIVTAVPPPVGPLLGDTPVTVGAPALPAGVVAVMLVLLTATTFAAAAVPNVTVAPEAKFVPVIVTAVPPPVV